MPCELKAAGKARGGHQRLAKNVFDRACFTARDCTCVEVTMKQFCLGIIVAIGLTLPAFAQEAVKPDGIYQLNLAKSTIRGPSNKSLTLSYTGDEFTAIGFDANGKPITGGATVIGDGKSRPQNTFNSDATTYSQIDPYTISISRTKAGKVVETGTRIVNPDGKTVWITAIGTTPTGQSYSHVLDYEKQ
jgi:hypothetical protein